MDIKIISNNIEGTPPERVPSVMKDKILNNYEIIFDSHMHIFNYDDVPDGYIGIRIPFTSRFLIFMQKSIGFIGRFINKQSLTDLSYFLDMFNDATSEEIFNSIKAKESADTVYVVLLMNMRSIKGKLLNSFEQQMDNIKVIRNKYPDKILPFVALDPNDPNMLEHFVKSFDSTYDYNFFGVKIYPCLGYLPSHPKLMEVFEICERKSIPVITHCSGASVKSSNKNQHLLGLEMDSKGQIVKVDKQVKMKTSYDFKWAYNHPEKWIPVLETFPRLKLDLGHFAGEGDWITYGDGNTSNWVITALHILDKYDNAYADFSYNLHSIDAMKKLKEVMINNPKIADKVLFGSDFYMVLNEGKYLEIKTAFNMFMGAELMKKIQYTNPLRFLFNK